VGRAIVRTRKNQIGGRSGRSRSRTATTRPAPRARPPRSSRKLLQRPSMHGSRPNSRSWRQFMGMWIEDLLVLDRGCIEKERDGNGWIVAIYNVDGATIRPNIDEMRRLHDDAYVQVVDGRHRPLRHGRPDLRDGQPADRRALRRVRLSPLEKLIVSVTADLHAAKYNASYFEKGASPRAS
jgi:hypothetical protein